MMKNPKFISKKQQRGVALLEVLVSLLLFSLGILGLIGLQARAVTLSIDAEDRNRAALLANELATLMWTKGTVNLADADKNAWVDRVAAQARGGLSNGVGTITPNGNVADIRIEWYLPSRSSSEKSVYETRVVLP